jgi:hypothetical protein
MIDAALDRRLTTRVLNTWKRLAGSGFPRRSQIDPRDFGTDWSYCLMIDVDPVLSNSRFSHVGSALRDPTWPTFDRQTVEECLAGTLLGLLARKIPQVVTKKKPIAMGGAAYHDNCNILYRTILMPLSESGDQIDGILVAIAYREVAAVDDLPSPDVAIGQRTERTASPRTSRQNGAGG